MKRIVPIAALALASICQTASAMTATAWDLRGSVPAGLTPQNLTTVEITTEGMYVRTDTDGFIQLPAPGVRADVLAMTVTNVDTPELGLIWRTPDLAPQEYYQAKIALPTGTDEETILALNEVPEWDPNATTIALAFPAGAEVLVADMEWRSYSGLEKLWNGVVSFWRPDVFSMYSINFLWGPLIATTPEGRATLFDTLPPKAWSATRFMYGFLAVAAVAAGAWAWNKPDRRRTFLTIVTIVFGATWILFDARMTQEIASYAAHDWSTYVLADPADRELRMHRKLYDTLETADELLGDDPSYVLVENDLGPYFANARYRLYPAVPVTPEEPGDATAWLVLGRPDIRVRSGGVLVRDDGTVLSPRGTVLREFGDYSFFYRSEP